ncbi:MAG TPA: DDE-type integrase/transposase/recombinase [Candidatus Binataceae bacterium]|nr:DDE-type integrase/transposase/recombinase [Candidatus Binataceae bacterium]
MPSVSRLVDVSINTVTRELILAGEACFDFHDRTVRNVQSKRVQADEIWSFCQMKEKQARAKMNRPANVGDVWTWTGIDADSKLLISYFMGSRDADAAMEFMTALASRLANRVQLTTDGHHAYLSAVDAAFSRDIDYAMLVKIYGTAPEAEKRYSPPICLGADQTVIRGRPDPDHISTSYVERANLTRMSMRRFTRLTNAFSKKFENHCHMIALYAFWYNFVRIHKTLRVTPAMQAGIATELMTLEDAVGLIDELEAQRSSKSN